jgi:soluble lytic murein transglycosylase-like protein
MARRNLLPTSAFAAVTIVVAGAASADIYTYTDSEGVVHFSTTRTPGAKVYIKADKAKQRSSITPVMPSDTSIERFTRYDDSIREAATLYQIPTELVRAIIKVESDYDPRAVSVAGARGLMQMIPATAERMQVRDAFDPRENIFGGVRYLRVLANTFNGDLQLTIAGYNAGEGAVIRYGGIPPYEETRMYVAKVLAYYQQYRAMSDPANASVTSPR